MALDAYERAARINGTSGRRHRVEHIEAPTRADIARFKPPRRDRLHPGPVREPGPEHVRGLRAHPRAGSGVAGHGLPLARRGGGRPGLRQRFARLLDGGPARHLLRGHAHDAGRHARRRLAAPGADPAEAALRHFTRDAAYASFEEGTKGTLAPGCSPTSSSSPTTSSPPARADPEDARPAHGHGRARHLPRGRLLGVRLHRQVDRRHRRLAGHRQGAVPGPGAPAAAPRAGRARRRPPGGGRGGVPRRGRGDAGRPHRRRRPPTSAAASSIGRSRPSARSTSSSTTPASA